MHTYIQTKSHESIEPSLRETQNERFNAPNIINRTVRKEAARNDSFYSIAPRPLTDYSYHLQSEVVVAFYSSFKALLVKYFDCRFNKHTIIKTMERCHPGSLSVAIVSLSALFFFVYFLYIFPAISALASSLICMMMFVYHSIPWLSLVRERDYAAGDDFYTPSTRRRVADILLRYINISITVSFADEKKTQKNIPPSRGAEPE